ncbi:Ig-like domain-containing protein [Microbacterium sp. NPDC076911]|uniref:Ig-like domain-containing protein n=1 Tax=Microbacterium sp. NPDC076911 TaxID=3154958 RepID=UPI00343F90E3
MSSIGVAVGVAALSLTLLAPQVAIAAEVTPSPEPTASPTASAPESADAGEDSDADADADANEDADVDATADADVKAEGSSAEPLVAADEAGFAAKALAAPTVDALVEGDPEEAITPASLSIVEDEQYDQGAVQVNFELKLDDSLRLGDTVTLQYPALLRYDNNAEALILDAEGAVVARGQLTDAASRTITFTFTDYVDTHQNVTVSGHLGMTVDDPAANTTAKDFDFVLNGEPFTDSVITMPAQRPPLTHVYITGVWNDEDRGRTDVDGAITWTANLPEGAWESQTVTVVPSDATSLFDCSTLTFFTTQVADGALYHSSVYEENSTADGDDPSYAEVVSCTTDELVVAYTESVDANFVRQMTIEAAAADKDATSQFGITITNSDIVNIEGGVFAPTEWYNFVARDVGTGEGGGVVRQPDISLLKYSTDEGALEGDFETAPGKTLATGEDESITFEVINTGNEALSNIVLEDVTESGSEIALVDCDFDGITLQAGESVSCEGIISDTSEPGLYSDTATVSATSVRDEVEVTDSDSWHGTVEPAVEVSTPLAVTGGSNDIVPLYAGIAALALLAGSAMAYRARRHQLTLGR